MMVGSLVSSDRRSLGGCFEWEYTPLLAPRTLSDEFARWNVRHKSPNGPQWLIQLKKLRPSRPASPATVASTAPATAPAYAPSKPKAKPSWKWSLPGPVMRLFGPFAYQANSATRAFEYPWIYQQVGAKPGMKIIDLGAGASGLQFVMADSGAEVTTVDPLINPDDELDWVFTDVEYHKLNRAFGNKVRFIREFLENAKLPADSFDRVVACSVIEHIPQEPAVSLMREVGRVLKPGGRFVATIDLFLDTVPFTDKPRNMWGTNVSVRALIEASGLKIVVGNKAELFGYPEFDPATIKRNRDRYLVVNDVLTQCVVLEK